MSRPLRRLKNCDVCGIRKASYQNRKLDSFMCSICMDNHLYEKMDERGWIKIREK